MIPQAEYLERYAARMREQAGLTKAQADDAARAVPFEDLSEMFEDDPEGAADMEMSYWEP